jgi:nucleotide-binding universal stress UspA family protein
MEDVPMKHILVPVDGSACTGLAIAQAQEFARIYGSRITLLHVYDISYFSNNIDFGAIPWNQEITNAMIKRSNDILQEAKKHFTGMEDQVETLSLEGNPASTIINYVSQQDDIDLVIMGSYGMGGFRRFFLGSTTHKVAVAIEKPILIL